MIVCWGYCDVCKVDDEAGFNLNLPDWQKGQTGNLVSVSMRLHHE